MRLSAKRNCSAIREKGAKGVRVGGQTERLSLKQEFSPGQ